MSKRHGSTCTSLVQIAATRLLLFPPSETAWNGVETSGVSLHKLAARTENPSTFVVYTHSSTLRRCGKRPRQRSACTCVEVLGKLAVQRTLPRLLFSPPTLNLFGTYSYGTEGLVYFLINTSQPDQCGSSAHVHMPTCDVYEAKPFKALYCVHTEPFRSKIVF